MGIDQNVDCITRTINRRDTGQRKQKEENIIFKNNRKDFWKKTSMFVYIHKINVSPTITHIFGRTLCGKKMVALFSKYSYQECIS